MNIDELNKKLGGYKSQLDSAANLQREVEDYEMELLKVIKEEMKKRGINAIKLDLLAEMGDDVDLDDWCLMYLYEDDERREVASTVYLDGNDNLQFVAYFEQDGFSDSVVTLYCQNPETPALVFSVGPLNLESAEPTNDYGEYNPGYGIITGDCDPYKNGVIHLAAVFDKCMKIYDKSIAERE